MTELFHYQVMYRGLIEDCEDWALKMLWVEVQEFLMNNRNIVRYGLTEPIYVPNDLRPSEMNVYQFVYGERLIATGKPL